MVSKVTKRLNLGKYSGFKDLKPSVKNEVITEVADYVKESILSYVGGTKSPVDNQPFDKLSKKYEKRKGKLSSSAVPNLELTGKMLDSLEYKPYRGGFEIGIFDETQAQKADNHCKFSAKSKSTPLPQRQFIPKKDEGFARPIEKGIKDIIKEYTDK